MSFLEDTSVHNQTIRRDQTSRSRVLRHREARTWVNPCVYSSHYASLSVVSIVIESPPTTKGVCSPGCAPRHVALEGGPTFTSAIIFFLSVFAGHFISFYMMTKPGSSLRDIIPAIGISQETTGLNSGGRIPTFEFLVITPPGRCCQGRHANYAPASRDFFRNLKKSGFIYPKNS